MAVTSGFFNAVSGDRTYSAEQFGALFNGIITDGIFHAVGEAFRVWTLSVAPRSESVLGAPGVEEPG